MDLPVLAAASEASDRQKTLSSTPRLRIGWIIPCTLLVAGAAGYFAYAEYAALTASLDQLAQFMQSPQF